MVSIQKIPVIVKVRARASVGTRARIRGLEEMSARTLQAGCRGSGLQQVAAAADTSCGRHIPAALAAAKGRRDCLMNARLRLLSSGSQQKPVLSEECLVKTELLILSSSLALSFQKQPLNPLQQGSFLALSKTNLSSPRQNSPAGRDLRICRFRGLQSPVPLGARQY